ncbi:MAG TPA: hypothetical protein VF463_00290 [Sphingobium sp.]
MNRDMQSAMDGAAQDAERAAGLTDDLSLGESVKRAVSAVRESIDAELSLVRLRAAIVGSAAKWIAILGVIAFITAFGMIVTLMIGAIMALAPLWGLGLALLAVTGAALLAILLCGWGISVQINRIKRVVP